MEYRMAQPASGSGFPLEVAEMVLEPAVVVSAAAVDRVPAIVETD